MACCGMVDVSDDGKQFWLPPHRRPVLCELTKTNQIHMTEVLPIIAIVFNKLLTCFQTNGPKGMSPDS